MRHILLAVAIAARVAPAHADPPTDRERALHAALIAAMGATYLTLEFGLGSELSPTSCRWCAPTGFDVAARNALRWHDTALADSLSTTTGYIGAPLAAASLLVIADWPDGTWRQHYDDVAPIVEAAIATSLVQHATKLIVARQRPAVHFAPPGSLAPSEEDNVSFFSGHTSLAFSLAVSSSEIASARGYRIAPAVWATTLALAATTGYLRIAADRHYATDVLTGAAVGSLVGYAWPRWVFPRLGARAEIVPAGTGLAVAGSF